MGTRMNYGKTAPGAMLAMNRLETYIANCALEPALKELVRPRKSNRLKRFFQPVAPVDKFAGEQKLKHARLVIMNYIILREKNSTQ